MILLLDNYDSFTYNIYQYLELLGGKCKVVRNDQITVEQVRKLKPTGIVISPGPGNPDSAGITLEAIRTFAGEIPILGVCLGHQAIGQAFGGKVVHAKRLMHGKTSQIKHQGKGVFRGLANPFVATRYHSLVVEKSSLPDELIVTAESEDGVIMGLKHRKLAVEGVQFHPESVMTTEGLKLLKNFLQGCGEVKSA